MTQVDHNSNRAASRRLGRVFFLLRSAGEQLTAASHASPDRHHRKQLHNLAVELRELSVPLSRIASHLERGGRK